MERAESPPTFLTLPPEIRQMIYEHTFQDQVVDISDQRRATSAERNAGLLLACHLTHNEAIKTYYTLTIFFTRGARQLGWLETIPLDYRNWIQELRCTIDVCQDCIVAWSTSADLITKYLWRKFYRDQYVVGRLEQKGIFLREGVARVDVDLRNGHMVWSAEPENWMPMEYEEVPENELGEWEIEEMPSG